MKNTVCDSRTILFENDTLPNKWMNLATIALLKLSIIELVSPSKIDIPSVYITVDATHVF